MTVVLWFISIDQLNNAICTIYSQLNTKNEKYKKMSISYSYSFDGTIVT